MKKNIYMFLPRKGRWSKKLSLFLLMYSNLLKKNMLKNYQINSKKRGGSQLNTLKYQNIF